MREAHPVATPQHVPRRHFAPLAADLLIRHRLVLPHLPGFGSHQQFSASTQPQPLRPADAPADGSGIGSRSHFEVIFQLAPAAVIDHVNAAIHVAADHSRVIAHAGLPPGRVVADEVVTAARQLGFARHDRRAVGVDQPHANGGARLATLQAEHGLVGGEPEGVAGAARRELDAGVELPLVALEAQGKVGKGLAGACLRGFSGSGCRRRRGRGRGAGGRSGGGQKAVGEHGGERQPRRQPAPARSAAV